MTARPEPMPYDKDDVIRELAGRNAQLVIDTATMAAQLRAADARITELEAASNGRPKRAPAKAPKVTKAAAG